MIGADSMTLTKEEDMGPVNLSAGVRLQSPHQSSIPLSFVVAKKCQNVLLTTCDRESMPEK
jgi:hypothetical protein